MSSSNACSYPPFHSHSLIIWVGSRFRKTALTCWLISDRLLPLPLVLSVTSTIVMSFRIVWTYYWTFPNSMNAKPCLVLGAILKSPALLLPPLIFGKDVVSQAAYTNVCPFALSSPLNLKIIHSPLQHSPHTRVLLSHTSLLPPLSIATSIYVPPRQLIQLAFSPAGLSSCHPASLPGSPLSSLHLTLIILAAPAVVPMCSAHHQKLAAYLPTTSTSII